MPIAQFAADAVMFDAAPSDTEYVTRKGKFFEIGQDFTDMNGLKFGFSTPAEADAALSKFVPFQLTHEHGPSVFDGLLGEVNRLWREDKDIMAEYRFPKLLHQHMGGRPIPISSEWDAATKLPVGGSIVLRGAVRDAVMMSAAHDGLVTPEKIAAFAMTRHNTPQGQMSMQDLHDAAARAGAVCDRGNVAQMASQHEATGFQKIHDETVKHGATCASGEAPPWSKPSFSRYSLSAPDALPHQPARPVKGDRSMPLKDKIKALFGVAGVSPAVIDQHLTDEDFAPTVVQFSAAETAQFAADRAELARLRLKDQERDTASFASFVDGLVSEGRALPYEKPALVAQFAQAARDDAQGGGTVKFSALDDDLKPVERDGSRVDALKAALSLRPSHGLTRELSANGGPVTPAHFEALTAQFARGGAQETAAEKKTRIDNQADAEWVAQGHKLPRPSAGR